jgi:hypothetical protein
MRRRDTNTMIWNVPGTSVCYLHRSVELMSWKTTWEPSPARKPRFSLTLVLREFRSYYCNNRMSYCCNKRMSYCCNKRMSYCCNKRMSYCCNKRMSYCCNERLLIAVRTRVGGVPGKSTGRLQKVQKLKVITVITCFIAVKT